MKRAPIVFGSLLLVLIAPAGATDTEDLIALDKKWGEAGVKGDASVSEQVLTDKVVSVTPEGVRGKKEELADVKAESGGARYEPTDYKVTFVTPDIAVMTHGTKGDDAHYSLHVWSRKGGKWQVVATSTTPMKDSN